MKALTAQADDARTRRYAEPIYLLTLVLYRDQFGPAPVASTFYLSDQARTELGQTWLPLVQSWGAVGDAIDQLGPGGSIGALDVVLFNSMPIDTPTTSAPRFSDMIRSGLNGGANTYEIGFGEATLTVLFKGGTAGDQLALFGLRCEEVTDMTAATCVLRMTGREMALEDAEDLYRVSSVDFPLCDPDAVGEPIPYALGHVTDVPGIGLVSGIVHKLAADLAATGALANIPVSDADLVARMAATGTVQIDSEQFTYTGRNVPAMLLTGITRAAFGTEAVAHARGAPVFQVLSEYVYAFAANPGGHLTAGVPRLRSDGALIAPGSYTVELNNTTLKAGRQLVVARFPVLPIISKQIQLEIVDTINVSDQIGVHDSIAVQDLIDVSDTIGVYSPSYESFVQGPYQSLPQTCVLGPVEGNASDVTFSFPPLPPGGPVEQVLYKIEGTYTIGGGLQIPPRQWYWTVRVWGPNLGWNLKITDVYAGAYPTPSIQFYSTVYYPTLTVSAFTHQAPGSGASGYERPSYSVNGLTATVRRQLIVQKTGGANKVGAATKAGAALKTGTTVKVGTVTLTGNSTAETVLGTITADLEGLRDTPTGTVTAVTGGPGANAQLVHPADVTYALMREVYGETDPAKYRAASWQAARSALGTEPRWDFLFRGGTWSDFRRLVGLQSRCDFFMEGGQYLLVYRELKAASHRFDARNSDGEPTFGWTPRTELVTTLTALYDPQLDSGIWRGSLERRSTKQTTRYGSRRRVDKRAPGGRDLSLPWIREAATASMLANYWLGEWEVPRMTLTVRGYWDALTLEKGDIVTVDSPLVAPFGTLGFAVRGKRYQLGTGTVEIDAVEVDQFPSELTFNADYFILHVATRTLPTVYALLATLDLTRDAAYRLLVPGPAFDVPGRYYIALPVDLSHPAVYMVRGTVERDLAAGYAILGLYDSALLYDDGIHAYDGAVDPSPRHDGTVLYDDAVTDYDAIFG